jgi:hypothetical protein
LKKGKTLIFLQFLVITFWGLPFYNFFKDLAPAKNPAQTFCALSIASSGAAAMITWKQAFISLLFVISSTTDTVAIDITNTSPVVFVASVITGTIRHHPIRRFQYSHPLQRHHCRHPLRCTAYSIAVLYTACIAAILYAVIIAAILYTVFSTAIL